MKKINFLFLMISTLVAANTVAEGDFPIGVDKICEKKLKLLVTGRYLELAEKKAVLNYILGETSGIAGYCGNTWDSSLNILDFYQTKNNCDDLVVYLTLAHHFGLEPGSKEKSFPEEYRQATRKGLNKSFNSLKERINPLVFTIPGFYNCNQKWIEDNKIISNIVNDGDSTN